MTELRIHYVKEINTELKDFYNKTTGKFYTLTIWITTDNGKEEITLFGKNKESLKIHN